MAWMLASFDASASASLTVSEAKIGEPERDAVPRPTTTLPLP